ncbi:MAG TPA: hypothetical protein G4O19_02865 [Dehalococcoidia bacterium]|nr:hypothetical protein [Dehalococcoidia bacterium]
MDKTTSGLQENVAGLLCYALFWVSGLILYLVETENRFIRFHAVQSIIVFGFLNIAAIVFGWIPWFDLVILPLIGLLVVILWIVLMVRAYQGTMYKLPVAGDLAEKWSAGKSE